MASKPEKLKTNFMNKSWWINKAYPYLTNKSRMKIHELYGGLYYFLKRVEFMSVPESDWDNLIILDACRYDVFKQKHDFEGELQKRYSLGPQTPVFLKENFGDGNFQDIVYVSANPHQAMQLNDSQFHDVYHLWRTHWDDELKTVHPSSVTEVASSVFNQYPHKRVIVHYMQPHAPFIGTWARDNIGIYSGYEHARQNAKGEDGISNMQNPYSLLEKGELKRCTVKKSYEENLEIVLDYVSKLLKMARGKSVITADHGEMFGERAWPYPTRAYQHPAIMAEKLLEVPWLILNYSDRKTTKVEQSNSNKIKTDTQSIENKLKHLGYA